MVALAQRNPEGLSADGKLIKTRRTSRHSRVRVKVDWGKSWRIVSRTPSVWQNEVGIGLYCEYQWSPWTVVSSLISLQRPSDLLWKDREERQGRVEGRQLTQSRWGQWRLARSGEAGLIVTLRRHLWEKHGVFY